VDRGTLRLSSRKYLFKLLFRTTGFRPEQLLVFDGEIVVEKWRTDPFTVKQALRALHNWWRGVYVKELRLAGISDLGGANRFLEEKFLPELNRRFWVKPAQEADAHQPVPRNLAESLNWEEERVVQRDWTVAWQGRWFQIDSGHEALCLVGRSVILRQLRDDTVQLLREGQKLKCRELAKRPLAVAKPKPARRGMPPAKPKEGHPWRQFGTGVGKEFWRGVKARARSARQLSPAPRSASASLRPHSGPGRVAKKVQTVNNRTKGDIFS